MEALKPQDAERDGTAHPFGVCSEGLGPKDRKGRWGPAAMRVQSFLRTVGGVGSVSGRSLCHRTVSKSRADCKPGSGAVGPLPGRASEGSSHTVSPGPAGGWPVAFISAPPLSSLSQALQEDRGRAAYRSPPPAPPLQCPAGLRLLFFRRRRRTTGARCHRGLGSAPTPDSHALGHLCRRAPRVPVRPRPLRVGEEQSRPGWPPAGRWPGSCSWRRRGSEGRRRGPGSPSARMC